MVGTETRSEDLAALGDATFSGYAVVNIVPAEGFESFSEQRERLRGDVTLDVSFGDGTISGAITELTYRIGNGNDDPVDGSLIMEETVFDVNGYRGDVNLDPVAQAAFELDDDALGQYSGAFYGANAEETAGALSGAVTGEVGDANFYGFFSANQ